MIINKTIVEAIQARGRNARGLSPFLNKLICKECQSTEKQFDYRYYLGSKINLTFHISSNTQGEYHISLKDYSTCYLEDINLLSIINRIKSQLDISNYEFDEVARLFLDQQSGVRILCKCGNSVFKTE